VLFVATAEAGDEEMRQRIKHHQKARPATWSTLEATTHIGSQITQRPATWSTLEATTHIGSQITQRLGGAKVVIVDCITLLVNNTFGQYSHQSGEQIDAPLIEKNLTAEINELVECIDQVDASFIIVTNEVGLGLVPANTVGRLYRDLLGRANQVLAQRADEVYLMVAGLPVLIKPAQYNP